MSQGLARHMQEYRQPSLAAILVNSRVKCETLLLTHYFINLVICECNIYIYIYILKHMLMPFLSCLYVDLNYTPSTFCSRYHKITISYVRPQIFVDEMRGDERR
jgi:hypothetical protein